MPDIDNMTQEQLDSALLSEIANLNWGWEQQTEVNNDVEAEWITTENNDKAWTQEEQQEWEADLSKSEKKIKKLLSQRNEERDAKKSLEDRLHELERERDDAKFYKENPQAEEFKDLIDAKLSEKDNLTRQEAYLLVAWEQIIENNKSMNAWARKMSWTTPWNITNPKNPKDMDMSDLDAHVRELYKSWAIKI